MGNKGSGFRAWAQTWISRVTISLWCDETDDDKTHATLSFGGGGSSGYSGRSLGFCPDELVAALDANDPKINKIWARIERDFKRLDTEAPKAIARRDRRREQERKLAERERKAIHQMRVEIVREMSASAKRRLTSVTTNSPYSVDWDAEGNPVDMSVFDGHRLNLRRQRRKNGGWRVVVNINQEIFDIGDGQWVLPCYPEDLGLLDMVHDSGYGWQYDDLTDEVVLVA